MGGEGELFLEPAHCGRLGCWAIGWWAAVAGWKELLWRLKVVAQEFEGEGDWFEKELKGVREEGEDENGATSRR